VCKWIDGLLIIYSDKINLFANTKILKMSLNLRFSGGILDA